MVDGLYHHKKIKRQDQVAETRRLLATVCSLCETQ